MRSKRNQKYGSRLIRRDGLFRRSVDKRTAARSKVFISSNFSDVENNQNVIAEIQKLVGQAGLAAASEAKVLGIPKVFARDNKIIREDKDGKTVIVVEGSPEKTYFRHLNSRILLARKK